MDGIDCAVLSALSLAVEAVSALGCSAGHGVSVPGLLGGMAGAHCAGATPAWLVSGAGQLSALLQPAVSVARVCHWDVPGHQMEGLGWGCHVAQAGHSSQDVGHISGAHRARALGAIRITVARHADLLGCCLSEPWSGVVFHQGRGRPGGMAVHSQGRRHIVQLLLAPPTCHRLQHTVGSRLPCHLLPLSSSLPCVPGWCHCSCPLCSTMWPLVYRPRRARHARTSIEYASCPGRGGSPSRPAFPSRWYETARAPSWSSWGMRRSFPVSIAPAGCPRG